MIGMQVPPLERGTVNRTRSRMALMRSTHPFRIRFEHGSARLAVQGIRERHSGLSLISADWRPSGGEISSRWSPGPR